MIATGLARLLEDSAPLRGRRFGILAHQAAVSAELEPIHLALSARGFVPVTMFAPEHGYYGVEQDMVAADDVRDALSGVPIRSLYGSDAGSLRPARAAFAGLDLLLVDLQDVGARYYTFAATALWAAEAALAAGCEVWILDRPNPLGGEVIEGDLPRLGYESFVGAFRMPVRHGLTLAEIVLLEARRRGWATAPRVWPMSGWRRHMTWSETGLPWIAPSPNMPTVTTAWLYPGGCLIEATEVSEGRGTTRPFQLVGAPGLDPRRLAANLRARGLAGVAVVPTFFRPQFQKHCGELCAGIELVVTDAARFSPYRLGVELLAALQETAPELFRWRQAPYEFESDRPAIDLLTGGPECREAIAGGGGLAEWMASWSADEAAFREERRDVLLYPESPGAPSR
jgi:uncharacterized protein YbbC (DUF1343 family)